MAKGLTEKQKRFCEEYAVDWNGSRAYKAAYPSCKSDGAARTSAVRLLTNDNIKAYIQEYTSDIEKAAGISKLMAVKELAKFAFHSFDEINESWFERKEFDKLPKSVKDCIQQIDTKIIRKIVDTNKGPQAVDVEYVNIKLVDKRGALQDLAKLMGWNNPEKTVQVNINKDADKPLTKDERKNLNDELNGTY
jgi:phage terminase small subunit